MRTCTKKNSSAYTPLLKVQKKIFFKNRIRKTEQYDGLTGHRSNLFPKLLIRAICKKSSGPGRISSQDRKIILLGLDDEELTILRQTSIPSHALFSYLPHL